MLVSLILVLVVVGLLLWLVPMEPAFKGLVIKVATVVVVVLLAVWLLGLFGIWAPGHRVHLP